jgi:hypothetical protein
MRFTNKVYDVLKPVALIWLPALATLYFTVAKIWNLPDTENVIGTITAFDTFLGVVLGLSSKAYIPPPAVISADSRPDGHLVVDDSDPEKTTMSLELHASPEDLKKRPAMVLKVVHPPMDSPPIPGPHGG